MWVKTTIAILAAAFAVGCAEHDLEEPAPRTTRYDRHVEGELDDAVAMAAEGRYSSAAAELARLAKKYDATQDDELAAAAMFWYGFCLEKQGQIDQAQEIYEHLERRYADMPVIKQVRPRLRMLSEHPETVQ